MTLNSVTPDFIDTLRGLLPAAAIRDVTDAYTQDPRGRVTGQGGVVVAPATVDEVSVLVRAVNTAKIGIVPFGGGTGLVLGQIAADGPVPIILSMERMNAIRAVRAEENTIIAEAGAIIANVQNAAAEVDRLYPLSLASEGSCRVGGTLATNAGGLNVLRYGNARDLCLGLEAVLPDGKIWNGLTRLRKDNTGYDLRNLLIGSEGTLGVITAATLRLFPRPVENGTALMVVDGPKAALSLLAMAEKRMAGMISAFELMHRMGLDFLTETMPELRLPFAQTPEWMVLIDIGAFEGMAPDAMLTDLFEEAVEAGLVHDGLVAQSDTQRQEFWAVRENIPEGNRRIGSISSHDISVPLSRIPEFIERGGPALAKIGDFRINCFGHLGDGNLHYNVFPAKGRNRADYADVRVAVKDCVHELAHSMEGSISAEHGVGRLKAGDLARLGDPTKLFAMRAIKDALDPNGIMNPGAVLVKR
jgi:FAD/FMN-containing dehydrogenase